jgi:urea transport system substrate-binding protein
VPNLSGGTATMLANHHITKPVLIGEIQDDGQFLVVSATDDTVAGDAWSDYLEGSRDLTADWSEPVRCGNFNTETNTCIGSSQ